MRFVSVRSGLAEAIHDVDAYAVDAAGNELLSSGDPDRPMYYRSAVKPFQATVAIEAGLRIPPEHLALVCASHSGWPVHLAIVRAILEAAGLDESALQTPPAWPNSVDATALQQQRGARHPRSIFHNCSGKHAGMLAASVAAGWPTETYLEPDHPLQLGMIELIAEVTGVAAAPAGVDHCGAQAARGTVKGLALAFARLTVDDRFAGAADAVGRFPSLVADNERPNGLLGRWWGGPVKSGALGTIGLGRHGIGIATKARSGNDAAAVAAAIAGADQLGLVSETMRLALSEVAEPTVFGGGRAVGAVTHK
ncbi:MAG: asparaginase [Acidimicrobiia bacterium]|nr:MAG: asparaginase [Acidimicrobiia bacterium]